MKIRNRSMAMVTRNGRILIEKLCYGGRVFYSIPGGGIEPGETPEVTALRELKEECNLDGEIVRKLAVNYQPDGSEHYVFEVKIPDDQEPTLGIDPEEAGSDNPPLMEVSWRRLDELSERDRAFMWSYGLMCVEGFFDELKSWGDEISYPGRCHHLPV